MTEARIATALSGIYELADPARRRALDELRERAQVGRLRILVAGEAKRGKSTLINGLVERDILPSGVVPLTAIPTMVRFDARGPEDLAVTYADGRSERRPLGDLALLVTETGNPANQAGIAAVTVTLARSPLTRFPVELVDTPGTGSVYEHNTATARAAYDALDAVILVIGADPPITAAERALLTELAQRAVRTFVVLNKLDQLDAADRDETVAFTRSVIIEAGGDVDVWPMSARHRDEGFSSFANSIQTYLEKHAEADLERALRNHLRRIAMALQAETELAIRAHELRDEVGRAQVAEFAGRLADLQRQAQDLHDELAVAHRRLRRDLDTHAAEIIETAIRTCRADFSRFLESNTEGLDGASVEQSGRERVADHVREVVSSWREIEAKHLTSRLAEVVARVEADRREHLTQLRRHAAELLTVDLHLPSGDIELSEGRAFWFAFADPPAWELPGTQLVRRHVFGAAKRAARRAQEAIGPMVDKQVGRARADLQQRLDETVRAVATKLHREHQQLLDGLARILRDAELSWNASAGQARAEREQLGARMTAMEDVIAGLDGIRERSEHH